MLRKAAGPGLDAAHRADPAGRALAATLHGAELHGETGHGPHVDRVVEHYDPGVTDQAFGGRQDLIVEGQIEAAGREIGA